MDRLFDVIQVITKEDNPEISLSVINLKGINERVVNKYTTAFYQCTKGEATFVIGNDDDLSFVTLHVGKSIKIDPGVPYLDFSGIGASLIAINKGAFDRDEVEVLPISENLMNLINKDIGAQRFRHVLNLNKS